MLLLVNRRRVMLRLFEALEVKSKLGADLPRPLGRRTEPQVRIVLPNQALGEHLIRLTIFQILIL